MTFLTQGMADGTVKHMMGQINILQQNFGKLILTHTFYPNRPTTCGII